MQQTRENFLKNKNLRSSQEPKKATID